MFIDEEKTTGYKYVNFYNSKDNNGKERIYQAVSEDGEKWHRLGSKPALNEVDKIDGLIISGDPQVVKIGDIYVMFYSGVGLPPRILFLYYFLALMSISSLLCSFQY